MQRVAANSRGGCFRGLQSSQTRTMLALGACIALLTSASMANARMLTCDKWEFISALRDSSVATIDFATPDCELRYVTGDAQDNSPQFGGAIVILDHSVAIHGKRTRLSATGLFHGLVLDPGSSHMVVSIDDVSFTGFVPSLCCGADAQKGAAIAATKNVDLNVSRANFDDTSGSSTIFAEGNVTIYSSAFLRGSIAIELNGAASQLAASNSTFSANATGGVMLSAFLGASLSHCTFRANPYALATSVQSPNVELTNNLFASGSSGNCFNPQASAVFTPRSATGNAEAASSVNRCSNGQTFNSTLSSPIVDATTGIEVVPLDHQDLVNLVQGAAALDCAVVDARNAPRRSGGGVCDAGAWEAQPTNVVAAGKVVGSAFIGQAFPEPFDVGVKTQDDLFLGGVAVHLTAPSTGASLSQPTSTVTSASLKAGEPPFARFALVANSVPGTYVATATFAGNAGQPLAFPLENVKPNLVVSALLVAPAPVAQSSQFSVSASVTKSSDAAPTPTGTLKFSVDGQTLCVSTLPSTACSATYGVVGKHDITVDYSGDGIYATASATTADALLIAACLPGACDLPNGGAGAGGAAGDATALSGGAPNEAGAPPDGTLNEAGGAANEVSGSRNDAGGSQSGGTSVTPTPVDAGGCTLGGASRSRGADVFGLGMLVLVARNRRQARRRLYERTR